MYNKTLIAAWDDIGCLRNLLKEKVKEIMGWKADAAFYDRVGGRVKCTPAEQAAFSKALKAIIIDITGWTGKDLFPEGEAKKVATVE